MTNNAINSNIPIEVTKGGTANTTFTANAVLCAGTTDTGAFQNVSGLGTAGQVLTAGVTGIPTWANLPNTQVNFKSYLSTNLTAATGDSTTVNMIFDGVVYNNGSAYNSSTGVFTAPVTGSYCFISNIIYSAQTTGGMDWVSQFAGTGLSSTDPSSEIILPTSNKVTGFSGVNGYISATFSECFMLNSGETISVTVQGNGGAKVDDIIGTSTGTTGCTFAGYLLSLT